MFLDFAFPLLADAASGAQTTSETGLPPRDSLTSSFTAEGLLFAAFALSYNLTQPKTGGRHWFFAQGWFALCIALTVGAVAVSAGAAWWATFQPDWPSKTNEILRAAGIAVAIVLQPVFAVVIAWQARES